jgi:hypothetical protein
MQDFAPAVFKALKLAELLAAAKQSEPENQPHRPHQRDGVRLFEREGQGHRQVEEEYKRESVSVAGLPELLERQHAALAGAAGMPVSLLMGQAPSGLNATGDSDIRWFYDHVAAMQEKKHLKPLPLKRLYAIIMLAKDGPTGGELPENWDIAFRPLWQMTPAEVEKMRLDVANAMTISTSRIRCSPRKRSRASVSAATPTAPRPASIWTERPPDDGAPGRARGRRSRSPGVRQTRKGPRPPPQSPHRSRPKPRSRPRALTRGLPPSE